jgi:hypothetical protein
MHQLHPHPRHTEQLDPEADNEQQTKNQPKHHILIHAATSSDTG